MFIFVLLNKRLTIFDFMRNIYCLLTVLCVIVLTSCRNEFDFKPSTGGLEFSVDTVYLDTVFTNIGSSTYTLKVYNRSNEDISIPAIRLAKGTTSKYRIMVDGMSQNEGKIFNNVELLANDSLYIFIETTVDVAEANPTDFLYTDQILFGTESNLQKVELVTLIQDAYFLYPRRDDNGEYESIEIDGEDYYGFVLDHNDPVNGDEYVFGNDKPYVIYGYAAVPSGETLVVEPGARVHFHDASAIIVGNGASMKAVGEYSLTEEEENQIIFEGDRLEPLFSDVPGQWSAIILTPGSFGHIFDHVTIKNAVIGLYIQVTDVQISNTQIYDCSNYGILAQTATITGSNVVINTAGQAALACSYGGAYNFTHSTFNNNWSSSRQVALYISNFIEGADPLTQPLTEATFNNCIIYGSNQIAMRLDKNPDAPFNYQFNSCLIKFNDPTNQFTEDPYDFNDTAHYNDNIFNENPKFYNISRNMLFIDETSPAFQQANDAFVVPQDIRNMTRTLPADIGAYKAAPFPE